MNRVRRKVMRFEFPEVNKVSFETEAVAVNEQANIITIKTDHRSSEAF